MMNSGRFQYVIKSERPVLVDFHTDWCTPCKLVGPVLKEIKDELKEAVRIIKVNVDKNPYIATKYNIRSIPTVILFKNGLAVWTGHGTIPVLELKEVLNGII